MNYFVLGLGNPGKDYDFTRHNLGFCLVDQWAINLGLRFQKLSEHPFLSCEFSRSNHLVTLAKSTNFMNCNGHKLEKFISERECNLANCLIVHDEVDLEFGHQRLSSGRGGAGHNGVSSVMNNLGSSPNRLRLGIGRPTTNLSLSQWVLSPFSVAERSHLPHWFPYLIQAIYTIIDDGLSQAMNLLNRKPQSPLIPAL